MPARSIEEQYANLSPFFLSQQRTFVMWVNGKLIEGGEDPVPTGSAAPASFKDGTVIAKLLQCLTSDTIPGVDWNPRNPLVVSANWTQIFKFMAKEKLELGGITALSLSQGNQKTCMALLWRFIQNFDLSVPIPGLGEHGGIDGLLKWVKPRTEEWYPGVKNFTSNWKDGVAFLALYDSIFPGELDMAGVDHSDYAGNLQKAFDLFEEKLGVQQMLRPEDVTGKSNTKNGNVCYILQIRNAVLKYEKDKVDQEAIEEAKKKDAETRRQAENQEHDNNGDKLYAEGVSNMNSTNNSAQDFFSQLDLEDKFSEIGLLDGGYWHGMEEADYAAAVDAITSELEQKLAGFDAAEGKFGEAKEEYKKITPPTDLTPEEKIGKCDEKVTQCEELKNKYRAALREKVAEAIKNDRGEKKYREGDQHIPDKVAEGGEILQETLDEVQKAFAKTSSPEERTPIAAAAEKKIADAADMLFDPLKGLFIEAEGLVDSPDRKGDCRKKLDEVDACKAQMLETIRIKMAELKAAAGANDELSPQELLELYHATTNRIEALVGDKDIVDTGIPANPQDIRDRLENILKDVHDIFGSKDTLRAKCHATVDQVFDAHSLP